MLSEPPSPAPSPARRRRLQLPSSDSDSDSDSVSEAPSPSAKKQKVVRDQHYWDTLKPLSPTTHGSDSDEYEEGDSDVERILYRPFRRDGNKIGDKECWKRYFQQIHDSEGFDITDYPGSGPMTTVFPMPPDEETKDYAEQALDKYNKKNATKYELKEVIKVNGFCTAYFNFYITFTVTNGKEEYFQAQVVEDVNENLDFPIIRPRVNGSSGV